MSPLNWRSRSVLAAGAAAVLLGTGVAALATTGSNPDAPPAASPQGDASLDDVRASLADLMSQADALESSLAATPTPAPTSDDDVFYDDAYDDHGDDDDDWDDDDWDDDDWDDDDRGDDHGGEDERDDD